MYTFWKISYVCNTSPFILYAILILSEWCPLKHMIISYTEKVTQSIQMSGNINSTHIRRGCTLQFDNFILGGSLSRVFGKEIIPWSYCDGSFNLAQINCRWYNCHVTFPRDVSWILFIVVVMDIFHLICKDQHYDESPVGLIFLSPGNTHHLVLPLQVTPSYFHCAYFWKDSINFYPVYIFYSQ